jgi:hypothetical protein
MNVSQKLIHKLEIVQKLEKDDFDVWEEESYVLQVTINEKYKVIDDIFIYYDILSSVYENMMYVFENQKLSICIHILNKRKMVFYHPFSRDELIACLELMKEKFNFKE